VPSSQAGCGWVLARNESTFSGVIKSMPVSTLCGIGTPSDVCHSMRMDIEPCIAGIVEATTRVSLLYGLENRPDPSMPTTETAPTLPAFLTAAAMPIGAAASQHR